MYLWSMEKSVFDLQQVWEGAGVLRHSELQALHVQSQEAQKLVSQEGVVEKLGREAAKHQLPHTVTVHRCHLTCTGSHV